MRCPDLGPFAYSGACHSRPSSRCAFLPHTDRAAHSCNVTSLLLRCACAACCCCTHIADALIAPACLAVSEEDTPDEQLEVSGRERDALLVDEIRNGAGSSQFVRQSSR